MVSWYLREPLIVNFSSLAHQDNSIGRGVREARGSDFPTDLPRVTTFTEKTDSYEGRTRGQSAEHLYHKYRFELSKKSPISTRYTIPVKRGKGIFRPLRR